MMAERCLQAALDKAGPPPPGYKVWPIDFGHSVLGPPQPIVIVNNVMSVAPRSITSYPDWRIYFVPEDAA
jgi:hypothetical protein